MGARTGEAYLKGLRDTNREIWLAGERVEDVAEHPMLRAGAAAIAAYYDLQLEHPDVLLIDDAETGEPINISHMQPRSTEDLRRRGAGRNGARKSIPDRLADSALPPRWFIRRAARAEERERLWSR
jgi:aromatic ring hydroxylase